MGKPIVTTDVPGCREVVSDGVNGLLVPARDADALALALERLLNDPQLRADFGEQSRALAKSFCEENVIRQTELIYQKARGRAPLSSSSAQQSQQEA